MPEEECVPGVPRPRKSLRGTGITAADCDCERRLRRAPDELSLDRQWQKLAASMPSCSQNCDSLSPQTGKSMNDPVQVLPARFVRLELATVITGYTVKAMYRKIEAGVWQETREWVRAPDGHLLLDRFGYERWAVSSYGARRNSRSKTAS